MKKKDQAPTPGSRSSKHLRLTLSRETLQRLDEPLLDRVMGGIVGHTFTGNNNNEIDQAFCG